MTSNLKSVRQLSVEISSDFSVLALWFYFGKYKTEILKNDGLPHWSMVNTAKILLQTGYRKISLS